ncbi:serine/arginine repetitive matrix protein 1 [Maniola jurtina]|uniref:serine/arginine repetitive matrix protein 1 n=1 Tax=Maniola jurtina TaxID=191418 RepID=UPI001E68E4C1|nr:serine/arginine repetitive matrix protein 1 [Maniola jurtina]
MMVETILESSQDFGMSNGVLPQWKRELLQRRAARARPPVPPPAPPPAPPPPPPPDDDEELRYGPGIVKRLKSRYLSLALREAPRRRPSVLRRAASLEHLLDERPPPAPPSARPHARPARPVSLAAPHALAAQPTRRESVKRARSVDALSRLDRDEPPPVPLAPPPLPPPPPPLPRAVRPPRRVTPLLRETERPPADVVRSTLRKFETAPPRRTAPAARVSAVLRGLENAPRSSTPEPRGRSPSPAAADLSAIDEPEGAGCSSPCEAKQVSRAALEGIARAGSSVRYSFPAPRVASHLPPLSATNPVLLGRARASASPRRVGVIRPMPAQRDRTVLSPTPVPSDVDVVDEKLDDIPSVASPPPFNAETLPKKDSPPSATVEPLPRTPPEERPLVLAQLGPAAPPTTRDVTPEPEAKPRPPGAQLETPKVAAKPAINGHATPPKPSETKPKGAFSKIGAAGIERAWTGAEERKSPAAGKERSENGDASPVPAWARGAGAVRATKGASPGGATSVVFNFSARKDVPDYIENDGIILRASRRNRFKAGESGIVVLRPEALEPDSESEEEDARPPSPCSVRFVNDNVLINGRSSMAARITIAKDRAARLKLQFDDSLTRTFEYPSETSLCEDSPAAPCPAPAAPATPAAPAAPAAPSNGELQLSQSTMMAPLAANTHLASASLSRYTPCKTLADSFALGMTRPACSPHESEQPDGSITENGDSRSAIDKEPSPEAEAELGDARPCAAESARSWSEARTHATDLLF